MPGARRCGGIVLIMPGLDRKADHKTGSVAFAGTVGHDAATVQFGKLAHHGESQAETAVLAFAAGIGLAEGIEYMREELPADAFAVVGDADFYLRAYARQCQCYVTAVPGELHRVRQQIPDDLLQPGGVAIQTVGIRGELAVEGDIARVERRA